MRKRPVLLALIVVGILLLVGLPLSLLSVELDERIQFAILGVLIVYTVATIFYTRASYRLLETATRQAASSEEMTRAAVEQSKAAVEQARAAVEQIEAAQRPCLVPRQFPVYNPQVEDLVLPEDQITLKIENLGNGPAINLRLYLPVPGQEFPEPEGRGPFQALALDPRQPLDTGIQTLTLPGRGPLRLVLYYESVMGRRYWTSADISPEGPLGGLWLTNLQSCKPV